MKNFIIISPHFPETYYQFAQALKRNGFRVLGVGDASYFEISYELRSCLDEYYCCYDMENYENEKRAVACFRNKYGIIDYLESNNEYWLERDSWLRNDFNIPNGVRPDELKSWQHKSLMKDLYKKAGVPVTDYIIVTDKENLLRFIDKVGYPVFAKPDVGVGASNGYKIKNSGDVDVFFDKKDPDITYICEQFVTGNIVSFDGICDDESNVVFCASNIFPPSVADIAEEGKDLFYYTDKKVPDDLKEIGEKVIKAFNVRKKFFHLEFFRLTENIPNLGKINDLVALETNMRPAGGYTPDLINFSQSVNCYQIYADVMAFNSNNQDMSMKKYYAACASRRDDIYYVHDDEAVLERYKNNICSNDRYPDVLSDVMGNRFFMAKFDTLEEVNEFRKYCETRL
ncbi:MAG: carbamoylphosphate synthase large subunit [Bacilli bacterium]|nr:carbamoylphosphate synthase large subunit [Bacilli bacterium]